MNPPPTSAAAESTPAAAGPPNFCDSCGREIGPDDGAFCPPCADDYTDGIEERRGWWG